MSEETNILSLPDLVLHHICTYISSPFDLLNLGSTCSRLNSVTSAESLWWNITKNWLHGLWFCMKESPSVDNPRQWFLSFLHKITVQRTSTKTSCHYNNGEVWVRVESWTFRCYLGMLQLSYVDKFKTAHPGVLYERWLYDIGLFRRSNSAVDFEVETRETLPKDVICELASLGQAKDRDLRARKQPHIDPTYYIKVVKTSHENWIEELFPCGPFGSKYPLLICVFQDALSNEVTGLTGVLMCLTMTIEKYIIPPNKINIMSPRQAFNTIHNIVQSFSDLLQRNYSEIYERWGRYCWTPAILSIITDDMLNIVGPFQNCLDANGIKAQSKQVLQELSDLIQAYHGIDGVVNFVRSRWRRRLFPEIEQVLFAGNHPSSKVTRVNLTDSDLIGGDNHRQEMSSAAFISDFGVLVTWQLIGRLRY